MMSKTEITAGARLATALKKTSRGRREGFRSKHKDQRRRARNPARNDLLPGLELFHRSPETLKPPEREIRELEASHLAEVEDATGAFGFVDPVLVTQDGRTIDGVARVMAARNLQLATIPCLVVDHQSETELRSLRIATNRIQERVPGTSSNSSSSSRS